MIYFCKIRFLHFLNFYGHSEIIPYSAVKYYSNKYFLYAKGGSTKLKLNKMKFTQIISKCTELVRKFNGEQKLLCFIYEQGHVFMEKENIFLSCNKLIFRLKIGIQKIRVKCSSDICKLNLKTYTLYFDYILIHV